MANDNIFGDPITTPLDATELGNLLDQVEAGDFSAAPAGYRKIQFTFQPVDGDDNPIGAQQNVRCRMADAAITAERARLISEAGYTAATFAPATLPDGTEGVAYSQNITLTGVRPYTIAMTGGTLPAGVSFVDNGDNTCTFAGTPDPATAGDYSPTLTATDADGLPTERTFALHIDGAPPPTP